MAAMRSSKWNGLARHTTDRPIDIVVEGTTPDDPAEAASAIAPLADAGATWWIKSDWTGATVDSLRRRIGAGPPAISG